ncbi:sister chromatid cohesion protein Mis4 [Stachybotrys elegans]|uniref:Sister chromatid cohesion protein n=1 Tax=Stachybotrys elegans TaxID=80388 RepID=A0A8K0WW60_9HYPO|nr:sister chromatid cohesion protein Mis4 [Stachybotrys elegans]
MNGTHNGLGSQHGQSNARKNFSRPLTVPEAVPFFPQTATIPFLPDIIPDPTIGSGSPALPLSNLFSTHEFERLNKEALSQDHLPKSVKHTVEYVLQDIMPPKRTQYTFGVPPKASPNHALPPKSLAQDLSPVTKAVYDKLGGYFKATKANMASPAITNGQVKDSINVAQKPTAYHQSIAGSTASGAASHNHEARQPAPVRIEVAIPSKKTIDRTAYLSVGQPTSPETPFAPNSQQVPVEPMTIQVQSLLEGLVVPDKHLQMAQPVQLMEQVQNAPPSGMPTSQPVFRVELSHSGINHDEYLEVAEMPDVPNHLSIPRTAGQAVGDSQDMIGQSLDQRQRADAALDSLEKLLRSIFSAVGCVLVGDSGYEHVVTLNNDQEPVVTAAIHQKLHSSIQKVIALGRYDSVSLEDLVQVMKLGENTLKQVDAFDIRVDEGWDEAAFQSWVQQLPEVDTALKAARTCLRLLSGGREDKQLYSEAMIHKCVNLFKNVTEDIIIPIVELRNTGSSADVFKMFLKQKKEVSATFSCCQKLFSLLADLVTKVELSETAITTLEYTASKLIFVENAYFEKDSAIGVQKFDGIRSVAMDMLCQVFLIKPEQRQGIIDDILTSLEKLPVGKQSSRQFKLSEGGSIQPVSALIMRLVQASSGRVDQSNERGRTALLRNLDGDDAEDEEEIVDQTRPRTHATSSITNEYLAEQQHSVAIQDLETVVAPLTDATGRNASYVINFIVKRAIRSTKSGDTPYRNLLDLFVEDFTTCLESPDWPSAELLLRLLMLMMVQLFEAGKTAAPTKNMALELLGSMSAAISRLRSHVKKISSLHEGSSSDELFSYLSDLANLVLEQKAQPELIFAWSGPFRTVIEHLQTRSSDDPHLASAISFLMTDWGSRVYTTYDLPQDNDLERDMEFGRMAYRLRMMVEDHKWLSSEYTFKAVSDNQAKLAYFIILLRSPLCESFNKILNILLGSMASDQATVRSKSLKSINQVLETDPSILDGDSTVIQLILDCSSDSSTQVRDSALGLLGNCIGMRPALEPSLTPKIIDRFHDAGVGVRKRAMKLARDIYLRNRSKVLRSAIANGLLRRVQDPDEGVRDLARQMIEEVWFAPFYQNDSTAVYQNSLTEHVALIIQTVKSGNVTEILDKVFQAILRPPNKASSEGKALEGPFNVCSKIVANMFGLIDNLDSDDPAVPAGRDALQVLTIFAKADPKLFNFEQIRLLKPQLASFSGADELALFRAVTVIYKRVLPQLPMAHREFLQEVRLQLLKGIGKISSRGALDDLIACARVCCDLLKDFAPLANLVASSLMGILKVPKTELNGKQLSVLCAYSIILGTVAKHCDLDQQIQTFRTKFPKWQGDSVPRLIVDTLSPFSSVAQTLEARKASLEAIGLVCQAWPRNYVLVKVYTAFQQVFQDQIPALETLILKSFKEFLLTEEKRSETAAENPAPDKKKLTVMGGTNFDDVASATTQRFLKDITRIALASQDEHAFLAMEVLGSINRQGLTHPKETGVTLITLETSANRKIAELAFMEHRTLHDKHETVLEREYVKAIQSAYNYQRDVAGDPHGAIVDTFQPKLHLMMEVLKISKMKNRQRFLDKLCNQIDFDWSKLESNDNIPEHVIFSRFIVENLAFFEYQTVGELQTVVHTLEKIVTSTGATMAQAIESEVFNLRMDAEQQGNPQPTFVEGQLVQVQQPPPVPQVDAGRLRQFTSASVILLTAWEARTHLRRLYGMGTNRNDSKAKALAKDLNKVPLKVQGVNGGKFWDEVESHMASFQSQDMMMVKCRTFVELMNVDKEFKVADEEEDVGMNEPATPSEDDDDEAVDRGRKRKGAGTPGGRKKRARSGSQPRKRGRPRKQSVDEDMDDELMDGDWM